MEFSFSDDDDDDDEEKAYYAAIALEKARYDAEVAARHKASQVEVKSDSYGFPKAASEGDEVNKSRDPYQIGVSRLADIQSFLGKSADTQHNLLKWGPLQIIRDLHKLLKHVTYHTNMKFPTFYKTILKDNQVFFDSFLAEKSLVKKKLDLLTVTRCGFLGILIQILTAMSSDVLPKLLEPQLENAEMGDYIYDTSDDEGDSEESEEEAEEEEEEESEGCAFVDYTHK